MIVFILVSVVCPRGTFSLTTSTLACSRLFYNHALSNYSVYLFITDVVVAAAANATDGEGDDIYWLYVSIAARTTAITGMRSRFSRSISTVHSWSKS